MTMEGAPPRVRMFHPPGTWVLKITDRTMAPTLWPGDHVEVDSLRLTPGWETPSGSVDVRLPL